MRGRVLLPMVMVALASGLVGCDHATKRVAERELKGQPRVELIPGVLDLRYVENRGIGFNVERIFPDALRKPLVYGPGLVAAPILLFLALRRRTPLLQRLAFTLLCAGALGNALDRLSRGFVVDFIHLHYWPIFNVADICISGGACLLIYLTWRESRRPVAAPG